MVVGAIDQADICWNMIYCLPSLCNVRIYSFQDRTKAFLYRYPIPGTH